METSRAVQFHSSFDNMNQQQSKHALDANPTKYRSNLNLRKLSRQVQFDGSRRRLLSRTSGNISASRVFFHKRTDRMKVRKSVSIYGKLGEAEACGLHAIYGIRVRLKPLGPGYSGCQFIAWPGTYGGPLDMLETNIGTLCATTYKLRTDLRCFGKTQIPKYQNTYRLESFHPFDIEAVDKLVKDTMESKLSTVTSYQPNQVAKLCLEIGSDLQKALCKKDYDRYKLVAQVTIVQRLDQSIHAGFQSLWDSERDNYSYHVFENNHIYAWCCVFGVYYE